MASFTEPATKEGLAKLMDDVFSWAEDKGIDGKRRYRFELIVEEVLVNIISHAFDENQGTMWIECRMHGNDLNFRIRDDGKPFDPTGKTAPDVSLSVDDRSVGGLGIFLVHEMADKVSYSRRGSYNILDIRMRCPEMGNT